MAMKRRVSERRVCKVVVERRARRRPGRGLMCGILASIASSVLLLLCVCVVLSIGSAASDCPALFMLPPSQQIIVSGLYTESPASPKVQAARNGLLQNAFVPIVGPRRVARLGSGSKRSGETGLFQLDTGPGVEVVSNKRPVPKE